MSNKFFLFRNWYNENLGKVVLIFLLAVVFGMLFIYVPFLNLIFGPLISFFILFFLWFVLFPPSIRTLVGIGIFTLFCACALSLLRVESLAEPFGEILYMILVLIGFRYLQEYISQFK